ncbi:MAG: FKBP-type peptidyl-prolyl cis-trans isomerase [Bacteroidales bacterium]|nr:FKBP-type peptidyl-prolyl cis-trans isomerase [Candidatus Sodaliphilus fimicaballi]
MKKILSIAIAAILTVGLVGCNEKGGAAKGGALADSVSMAFGDLYGNGMGGQLKADSTMDMKAVMKGIQTILKADTSDKSYMAGLQIGLQIMQMYNGVKQQYGIDINQKLFLEHFKKALMADSAATQEEMMRLQMDLEPLLARAAKEAKANDPVAIENKKAGEAYANKKVKEGYKKTQSGLVYKVLAEGAGENFKDGDVVMTKYVGKHIDGSEFDSSKGQAVPFDLKAVVPGFSEMLKLMKPGMKVEVVIPAELAYGEEGNQVIGPNETLVFEIETVEANKMDAPQGGKVPVEAAH